jgi:hypothetical protein
MLHHSARIEPCWLGQFPARNVVFGITDCKLFEKSRRRGDAVNESGPLAAVLADEMADPVHSFVAENLPQPEIPYFQAGYLDTRLYPLETICPPARWGQILWEENSGSSFIP